jgi:hypothetical protein
MPGVGHPVVKVYRILGKVVELCMYARCFSITQLQGMNPNVQAVLSSRIFN